MIKSLLTQREPAALKHRGRAAVMHRIEQRMRFLAVSSDQLSSTQCYACCWHQNTATSQADSASTLRGQYPSYRELLLRLCYKLEIKCPNILITEVSIILLPFGFIKSRKCISHAGNVSSRCLCTEHPLNMFAGSGD